MVATNVPWQIGFRAIYCRKYIIPNVCMVLGNYAILRNDLND